MLRKRFGIKIETPPNQPSVGSSADPGEIPRPEGRLFPADKRKNIPFSFLAQEIWPVSWLAALLRNQLRYRFSPLLVCTSSLQETASPTVSQMSFPSLIQSEKVFRVHVGTNSCAGRPRETWICLSFYINGAERLKTEVPLRSHLMTGAWTHQQ